MTPVVPYHIRKSEDGARGELLLRLKNERVGYMLQLPLEQARVLAVEMRGLGTDHCAHHHLAVLVAEALGGKVSHIILNVLDNAGDVTCVMRLTTDQGLVDATVDVAAALALAIHLGLPIFLEGKFVRSNGELRAVESAPTETGQIGGNGDIPSAFRELIDRLDIPGPFDKDD